MAKKAAPAKRPAAKKRSGADDGVLARYQHHNTMADKHRGHADLISAKLRTQGKRIAYGDGGKPQIKPIDNDRIY